MTPVDRKVAVEREDDAAAVQLGDADQTGVHQRHGSIAVLLGQSPDPVDLLGQGEGDIGDAAPDEVKHVPGLPRGIRRARWQASVTAASQVLVFLRDDFDWPIGRTDFEDLTFDYTPDELGIDDANAAKIQEIKRLRSLAAGQPWGVFFVKFAPNLSWD